MVKRSFWAGVLVMVLAVAAVGGFGWVAGVHVGVARDPGQEELKEVAVDEEAKSLLNLARQQEEPDFQAARFRWNTGLRVADWWIDLYDHGALVAQSDPEFTNEAFMPAHPERTVEPVADFVAARGEHRPQEAGVETLQTVLQFGETVNWGMGLDTGGGITQLKEDLATNLPAATSFYDATILVWASFHE